jgi:aminopeptidase N
VKSVTVNGKSVTPQYNGWFVTLAAKDLVKGRNTVAIAYERLHSTNGEGLHRMVDPVDGRVYTYSHFEPAAAHQMFAVFDQPDLKALPGQRDRPGGLGSDLDHARDQGRNAASKRWTFPKSKN